MFMAQKPELEIFHPRASEEGLHVHLFLLNVNMVVRDYPIAESMMDGRSVCLFFFFLVELHMIYR